MRTVVTQGWREGAARGMGQEHQPWDGLGSSSGTLYFFETLLSCKLCSVLFQDVFELLETQQCTGERKGGGGGGRGNTDGLWHSPKQLTGNFMCT